MKRACSVVVSATSRQSSIQRVMSSSPIAMHSVAHHSQACAASKQLSIHSARSGFSSRKSICWSAIVILSSRSGEILAPAIERAARSPSTWWERWQLSFLSVSCTNGVTPSLKRVYLIHPPRARSVIDLPPTSLLSVFPPVGVVCPI